MVTWSEHEVRSGKKQSGINMKSRWEVRSIRNLREIDRNRSEAELTLRKIEVNSKYRSGVEATPMLNRSEIEVNSYIEGKSKWHPSEIDSGLFPPPPPAPLIQLESTLGHSYFFSKVCYPWKPCSHIRWFSTMFRPSVHVSWLLFIQLLDLHGTTHSGYGTTPVGCRGGSLYVEG